jgi:hypothetical protein
MPKTVWKGPCPLTRKRELVPIGRNGFASGDDLRLSSKRGNRAEKKGIYGDESHCVNEVAMRSM